MIRGEHVIQCMPCSSQIISEVLSEFHTMEKCDFLKLIIHSQIIQFTVISESYKAATHLPVENRTDVVFSTILGIVRSLNKRSRATTDCKNKYPI